MSTFFSNLTKLFIFIVRIVANNIVPLLGNSAVFSLSIYIYDYYDILQIGKLFFSCFYGRAMHDDTSYFDTAKHCII